MASDWLNIHQKQLKARQSRHNQLYLAFSSQKQVRREAGQSQGSWRVIYTWFQNVPVFGTKATRYTCFCFFVFFPTEMWDPSRPKHPPKYHNTNIQRKKQTNPLTVRQGHIKHVRKISGSLPKTAYTLILNEFGVISLNQPLERSIVCPKVRGSRLAYRRVFFLRFLYGFYSMASFFSFFFLVDSLFFCFFC